MVDKPESAVTIRVSQTHGMDPSLRESIARYMWLYWRESNNITEPPSTCPADFYHMAEIAIRLTIKKVDSMLLDQMKNKLETLYADE